MMDYLKILRPYNLGFIAILMWRLVEQMPWYEGALLSAAAVLIAAGAFVINDYFDVKIDRINRPEMVIVTEGISKQKAMYYSLALTAVGVICGLTEAYLAGSKHLMMLYILVPGLLWFYSSSYKRILLVGDLVLSFCVALMPLTVCLAQLSSLTVETFLVQGLGISGMLFLLTWIVVLVESLMDIEGERELECHTVPVVWGEITTKILIGILCIFFLAVTVLVVVNY